MNNLKRLILIIAIFGLLNISEQAYAFFKAVSNVGGTIPAGPTGSSANALTTNFANNTEVLLPKWRLALSKVRDGSGNAKILCVGDSTTGGTGSTLQFSYSTIGSHCGRLKQMLNTTLNPAVDGAGIPASVCAGATAVDNRWTAGSGWTDTVGIGVGSCGAYAGTSSSGNLVYAQSSSTNQVIADSYYVYYLTNNGLGTLTLTATGGTPVVVNTNSSAAMTKVLVTAASASASNTLTATCTVATCYVVAVEPILSTAHQIYVGNAGAAGSTTGFWLANQPFTGINFITANAPDLCVISLGINDAGSSVPATSVQSNLQSLITACQASGDVLLDTFPPSENAPYSTNEKLYLPIISSLAASNSLPIMDIYGLFNSVWTSNHMYDGLHPNDLGYWQWAQGELEVILPDVGGGSSGGTPGGSNGQVQYNNNGQLSGVGQLYGLYTYGDSISNGTGATPFYNGYAFLASKAYGGPQSVAYTTRPGEQALDGGTFLVTGTANGLADYIIEYGTNDITTYNSSANLQDVFQRAYLHDLLWPSAVNIATYAQNSFCTASGSWTADNSLVTGLGESSYTNGNTLSCPTVIAGKANDNLYIGYEIFNGGGGTFTVKVDGVTQTDPISGSTTWVAYGDGSSNITTQNGGTYGAVAVRLTNGGAGWSAGYHTVLVTVTSATNSGNVVEPLYAVFAPSSTVAATLPTGIAVTPNQQNNSNNSLVPTYDGYVTTAQSNLASDGWNIVLANTNAALTNNASCTGGASPPFTNCYVDAFHPNNTGHAIMAATVEAAAPSSHLLGVQAVLANYPLDFLSGIYTNTPAAWWTPNEYGPYYDTGSQWNGGIAWDKHAGLVWGTSLIAGAGVVTFGPSSGNNIASWCYYNESGYGQYPTFTQLNLTNCPEQINYNQIIFFPSTDVAGQLINMQNDNLYIMSTEGSSTQYPFGTVHNYASVWINADPRTATSSTSYSSSPQTFRSPCWNGSSGTVDDFTWQNVSGGSGTSPSQTMTLSHNYGCSGTLTADLTSATSGVKVALSVVPPTTDTAGATPALSALKGLQTITLSANATPTISGIVSGERVTFEICQPSSGGPYTWTWPASIHGGMTIGTTAGDCSLQSFVSLSGSTLVAESAGIANVAP